MVELWCSLLKRIRELLYFYFYFCLPRELWALPSCLEYKKLAVVADDNDRTVSSGSVILYQGQVPNLYIVYYILYRCNVLVMFRVYQYAAVVKFLMAIERLEIVSSLQWSRGPGPGPPAANMAAASQQQTMDHFITLNYASLLLAFFNAMIDTHLVSLLYNKEYIIIVKHCLKCLVIDWQSYYKAPTLTLLSWCLSVYYHPPHLKARPGIYM